MCAVYILIRTTYILGTHHHFSTAAETYSVVVCGDDFKPEVGPAHVSKHRGRLDDAGVGLDDEAVLALWCGWDNQAVCHLTVIPSVLIIGLKETCNKHKVWTGQEKKSTCNMKRLICYSVL